MNQSDIPTMLHNASYSDDFQFKATTGQINIDSVQGIVEAFVSAIGNKDSVGDIVLSGAFDSSLKRRKPRVVWGHDWNQPIGKVIEMFEVAQTDPRLPSKMKQAGVGALYAKVQFNLNTERGREAFANVAFYGPEQEWSIGYKTIVSNYDPVRQANLLREVELYEVSPVLHGANQLTSTLSVKNDVKCYDHDESHDQIGELPVGSIMQASAGKPRILAIDSTRVIFMDENGAINMSQISSDNGVVTIGAPIRVKPEVTFIPVGNDVSERVSVKLSDATFDELTQASFKGNYGYSDDNDSESDDKPDFLDDPMALLLMAYNEMLKWRGASNVRSATLRLISDVEKFLTSAPAAMSTAQGEEKAVDFTTVQIKATNSQCIEIKNVVKDIAIKTELYDNCLEITVCTKTDRDGALRALAEKLAALDFYPNEITIL